jgi:branched-chain amino acid transport system permease protein
MAYALVALGFVLALNAVGAVNFAHGDLVVLGGAIAVLAGAWTGLPGALLLPLVALALGLAGVIAGTWRKACHASRGDRRHNCARGHAEQGLTVTMGARQHRAGLAGSGAVEIAGFELGRQPITIVVVGAVLVVATWFLLERALPVPGQRMRAVALIADGAGPRHLIGR